MKEKRVIQLLSQSASLDPTGQQIDHLLTALDRHRFERRALLPSPGLLSERLEASAVELDFLTGLAPAVGFGAALAAASRLLFGPRCDLIQAEGWRPALVSLPRRLARGGRLIWVLRRPPLAGPEARAILSSRFRPDRIVVCGRARAQDFPRSWQERTVRIDDAVEIRAAVQSPRWRPNSELLIGPLSPEWDLDLNQTLLHAVRVLAPEFPALRLALAGPEVFRRAVELQTKTLGLEGKLQPVLAADEVAIAVVDAAAAPANLAWALACGIPTVAVAGSLPATVAVSVPWRNLEALVAAIRSLIREPARAELVSAAGRAYAEAEFGASRRAQRFEQLYEQLLS